MTVKKHSMTRRWYILGFKYQLLEEETQMTYALGITILFVDTFSSRFGMSSRKKSLGNSKHVALFVESVSKSYAKRFWNCSQMFLLQMNIELWSLSKNASLRWYACECFVPIIILIRYYCAQSLSPTRRCIRKVQSSKVKKSAKTKCVHACSTAVVAMFKWRY